MTEETNPNTRVARRRPLLYWGTAALFGIALGLGSAALSVGTLALQLDRVGPWMYSPNLGVETASHRLRAAIALIGLFALPQEEAIYFNAMTDGDGDLLLGNTAYRLETEDIDCRWWSVTVYGKHGYLLSNDENRYSYNVGQLEKNANERYVIAIAPEARDGYWIPTGDAASFDITLRIYNPSDLFREQLKAGAVKLPSLKKVVP